MTSDDIPTLVAALDALLRERAMAYQIASDYLARQQHAKVDQMSLGLSDIIRIKRLLEAQLDCKDTDWRGLDSQAGC